MISIFMALLAVGFVFVVIPAMAIRLIWLGDWDNHYVHTCGFHTQHISRTQPCAKCGKYDKNWENKAMRPTLFFGWETMKEITHGR